MGSRQVRVDVPDVTKFRKKNANNKQDGGLYAARTFNLQRYMSLYSCPRECLLQTESNSILATPVTTTPSLRQPLRQAAARNDSASKSTACATTDRATATLIPRCARGPRTTVRWIRTRASGACRATRMIRVQIA